MPVAEHFDVAIIGGGIVGLSNAWAAAERGNRVVLFERHPVAQGASIRNFGMVWPVGQPAGRPLQWALRSRDYWCQLAAETGMWLNRCGSIHLARGEDESQVLVEFAELLKAHSFPTCWLTPDDVVRRCPAARRRGLYGGLWSEFEMCVHPVDAIESLTNWLEQRHQVSVNRWTYVTALDEESISTSDGRRFSADRTMICSGDDFQTLFPHVFRSAPLRRCKLQMLATVAQPNGWRAGPLLTSGLTCRNYAAFGECPSLQALKTRVAAQNPDLDRYGIHLMASQNQHGEMILGDSHQYDDDISPFNSSRIDQLICEEIFDMLDLPAPQIDRRWSGVYAKTTGGSHYEHDVSQQIKILTGLGGSGMTLSFGLAEEIWSQW